MLNIYIYISMMWYFVPHFIFVFFRFVSVVKSHIFNILQQNSCSISDDGRTIRWYDIYIWIGREHWTYFRHIKISFNAIILFLVCILLNSVIQMLTFYLRFIINFQFRRIWNTWIQITTYYMRRLHIRYPCISNTF